MSDRTGFVIYHQDMRAILSMINAEDLKELITMLIDYSEFGEVKNTDNEVIKAFFVMLKNRIDSNNNKYEKIKEKRKEAGKQGGVAKANNLANASFAKQEVANLANLANAKNSSKASNITKDNITQSNITKDNITKDNININNNINTTMFSEAEQESGKTEKTFAYSDEFERFWRAYPKKVGKGGAYKAFKKVEAIKHTLPIMLEAIEQQKDSEQWKKDKGQFIPHPTTWLNQRRWEDSIGVENTKTHNGVDLDEVLRQGGNIYQYMDWRREI